MKKILLIIVALLFNSNVFAVDLFCHINDNDNEQTFITKFSSNIPSNDYDAMYDLGDQFADYVNTKYNFNFKGSECNENTKDYSISVVLSWDDDIPIYGTVFHEDIYSAYFDTRITDSSFNVRAVDWKPNQKTTKQPKTTITNNIDYTNKGYSNNPDPYYSGPMAGNPSKAIAAAKKHKDFSNDPYKYKKTPIVVNECVSIRKGEYARAIKNTCNFPINVWHCKVSSQNGCGSRKGLIYRNRKGSQIYDMTYGYNHFTGLTDLKAGEQQGAGIEEKYTIRYFACKGRYSTIVNDKKNATKFNCRTLENMLNKYGWGK